ncbi:acetylornithine deacetylase [Rhodobacter sp. NTK016B]|uniref:acetylornithine deacetylase n=1 Tax=Rhodobacter sp. NTK016B TaxID=2759676 RepID=UPI001A8E003B|nr:acetylornithine deacetylase [Rhodobacter sp. NTK016B]MBN8291667.1 acetylornithine deacetylase [Rhodobacter sp. NTK016B]
MTTPDSAALNPEAGPREILEALIAFPTVSRDTNLPLVDWVEAFLASNGIDSTRVMSPCGTKAHLYAQVGPDAPGGVVLSGHTDVVPVDGQAWDTDPWTLTEKDGKLYGRGTCDMKGFDALALWAMAKASRAPLTRPLQLAFSYDEEVGCMAVADLVEAMIGSDLPRAETVIVGEPSMMKVVTGHKGGLGVHVHIRGYEVHSSMQPYGVSAIMEGARLIQWCNDMNAANADNAPPSELAAPFDPPYSTLHVGVISGGTAHNITAKDCDFLISVRQVPGDTGWGDKITAAVREIEAGMQAIRPETGIDLEMGFGVPALAPEHGGPAELLSRRLTGDNGEHVVSYGTEGGQFQTRGYSVVVCGPGDIAQAHQPNEFLDIAQLEAGQVFMEKLLDELCQ